MIGTCHSMDGLAKDLVPARYTEFTLPLFYFRTDVLPNSVQLQGFM